jgi:hypothetical protein
MAEDLCEEDIIGLVFGFGLGQDGDVVGLGNWYREASLVLGLEGVTPPSKAKAA